MSDFTGYIERSQKTATFTAYPICLVNGGESTGLSTGAKIGIGVGVPLGVLLIAGVTFIWWYRRNKSRKIATEAAPEASSLSEGVSKRSPGVPVGVVKPELDNGDPMYQKAELDTSAVIASGSSQAPVEMPNEQIPSAPAELPAVRSPDTPQAELPGDFGYTAAKNDGGKNANVANVPTSIPTIVVDPSSPLSAERGTK